MDLYAPPRFTLGAALSRVFRVARDRPGAFISTLFADLLVLSVILTHFGGDFAVGFKLIGPEHTFTQVFEAQQRAKESLPAFLIVLTIWKLFSEVAWLRLLLGRGHWFVPPYRVWKDEGRLILIYLGLLALLAIAFVSLTLLGMIIWPIYMMVVLWLSAFDGVSVPGGAQDLFMWVNLAGLLVISIALIRLSPSAAVMTLKQKFEPLSGWSATTGASVRVAAAYAVVICLFAVAGGASLLLLSPNVMVVSADHPGVAVQVMTVIALAIAVLSTFICLITLRGVNAEIALVYRSRKNGALR